MAYDDDDDRFDDDVMNQPRGVRTKKVKGSRVNPKQLNPVDQSGATKRPLPDVSADDPGQDPTDAGLEEALMAKFRMEMLRKMLNPSMVPPGYASAMGPAGNGAPIEQMDSGGSELGALLDPQLMSRRKVPLQGGGGY